ncbi:hypothetical protein NEQG_01972 [Nematocida parisii ERTm3]|uniref:CNH domain-containing protein n=1 Tax=Nematocida parisii (strain ERTm3) TaxID=935791 RepID=I3EFA3_NEMP3|nr:hypothetical protein NEQG_01972 [Nematocida parisii ERTm3]
MEFRVKEENTHRNNEGQGQDTNTIMEVLNGAVLICKGYSQNKWVLHKKYKSFAVNEHLFKRGAFIGYTEEESLCLVRYVKGREDTIISQVESYAIFGTVIFYILGKTVIKIDITTGDKKVLIDNNENIGISKILLCESTLLIISDKVIHKLEVNTNIYTKLRLKVSLDHKTGEVVKLKDKIHLVVSCMKGNVYVFDSHKMEIIRSMKYFGARINAIGFWHPESTVLFILTVAGELLDVDYLNNRVLKRHSFPVDDYTRAVSINGKSIAFISTSKITVYSPYNSSIRTIYRSCMEGRSDYSYISIITTSIQNDPEKKPLNLQISGNITDFKSNPSSIPEIHKSTNSSSQNRLTPEYTHTVTSAKSTDSNQCTD